MYKQNNVNLICMCICVGVCEMAFNRHMKVRFGECISPIRYLSDSKEMQDRVHAGVLRRSMSAGDCESAWGLERLL
jgi:hypothetical protein